MVAAIKYGLAGSSHEKPEAMPLAPANRASTGVMQHSDAAIAVIIPVPINFHDDFSFIIIDLLDFVG